jgi:hypothetical protein
MEVSNDNRAIKLPFPVRWDIVAAVLLLSNILCIAVH